MKADSLHCIQLLCLLNISLYSCKVRGKFSLVTVRNLMCPLIKAFFAKSSSMRTCVTKCSPKRNGKTDFQGEVPLTLECWCQLHCMSFPDTRRNRNESKFFHNISRQISQTISKMIIGHFILYLPLMAFVFHLQISLTSWKTVSTDKCLYLSWSGWEKQTP